MWHKSSMVFGRQFRIHFFISVVQSLVNAHGFMLQMFQKNLKIEFIVILAINLLNIRNFEQGSFESITLQKHFKKSTFADRSCRGLKLKLILILVDDNWAVLAASA